MNKIININLAGRLIPMNESAYEMLSQYLSALKQYFSKEEGGAEILHDMEDRIGELLQEKIKKGAIAISDKEIEEVKAIMGSPEQIADETGGEDDRKTSGNEISKNQQKASSEDKSRETTQDEGKRMHRSSNEKMIGGVCGGLGAYFNLDPAIVRLLFAIVTLFWGTGLLIYVILWVILPERETNIISPKRRLYRNEDKRIIGGVCSGIASYFKVDTIWIRLIFLIPLLLGIGSGVLHEIFYFSLGGFPAMVLLYLILWVALPQANTVAEKLEMEGKKVDIKNISEAIKNQPPVNKSSNNGCLSVLIIFLKIVLIFIGAIVLLILLAVAFGLISALLGIGISTAFVSPFSGLLLATATEKIILLISLILVVVVPVYLLIYFLVRLISSRKYPLARWWSVTLIILFIAGVFGLFTIAGSVLRDFKSYYTSTEPMMIQPIHNDTLILSALPAASNSSNSFGFWDGDDPDFIIEGDAVVRFRKSEDSTFHATIEKAARGANKTQARAAVNQIHFSFQQSGNHLQLPEGLDLSQSLPFRNQSVKITLYIPEGKWIYLNGVDDDWWDEVNIRYFNKNIRYLHERSRDYNDYTFYQMNANGNLERAGLGRHKSGDKDNNTYYY